MDRSDMESMCFLSPGSRYAWTSCHQPRARAAPATCTIAFKKDRVSEQHQAGVVQSPAGKSIISQPKEAKKVSNLTWKTQRLFAALAVIVTLMAAVVPFSSVQAAPAAGPISPICKRIADSAIEKAKGTMIETITVDTSTVVTATQIYELELEEINREYGICNEERGWKDLAPPSSEFCDHYADKAIAAVKQTWFNTIAADPSTAVTATVLYSVTLEALEYDRGDCKHDRRFSDAPEALGVTSRSSGPAASAAAAPAAAVSVTPVTEDMYCTLVQDTNFRSGPATSYGILFVDSVGDYKVTGISSDKKWIRVNGDTEAWIHTSLCIGPDGLTPLLSLMAATISVTPATEASPAAPAEAAASTTTASAGTGAWNITFLSGATDQMRGKGDNPWPAFPNLNPPAWPEFPNVANDAQGFPAAWGLEFGEDESQFCGATGDQCDIVVAAGGYALITGYWELEGLGKCNAVSLEQGCAAMIVNVGNVAAEFKGTLDNVYVIQGRYWHGDHLPQAISAGLSHASWNMTNGESTLNPEGSVNAGSNCSLREACASVDDQFKVTSGNELLIDGQTTYGR